MNPFRATSIEDAARALDPAAVPSEFRAIKSALERKRQLILYGPPGTGKTFTAQRFAEWYLKDAGLEQVSAVNASPSGTSSRAWWVMANPREWAWKQLFAEGRVEYRRGRIHRNYEKVQPGDLVFGYQAPPDLRLKALARVSRGLYIDHAGDPRIELQPLTEVDNGPSWDELNNDPILSQSEPLRMRCQGTLFAMTEEESEHLLSLLAERDNRVAEVADAASTAPRQHLTFLTFHASYSYEDFIEGFRPVETSQAGLRLSLEDGVFKRICRQAADDPDRPYLIIVDEINRANVARVFGEIITLLELDKRGQEIVLPQSKQPFVVPPNVFLIGTMNTADRSIKLLDAALRRRFSFIELLPNSSLLSDGSIGSIPLDRLLDEINSRVIEREGREKQVGHSFFMNGPNPVTDPEEFAQRFRQEIIPLLQEYCYDDFSRLADYIGAAFVDQDTQRIEEAVFQTSESLIDALEREFATLDSEA